MSAFSLQQPDSAGFVGSPVRLARGCSFADRLAAVYDWLPGGRLVRRWVSIGGCLVLRRLWTPPTSLCPE
ncbi:MAG: hypothetical protein ACR2J5_03605 [Geodermatophilaceae bacterium]